MGDYGKTNVHGMPGQRIRPSARVPVPIRKALPKLYELLPVTI